MPVPAHAMLLACSGFDLPDPLDILGSKLEAWWDLTDLTSYPSLAALPASPTGTPSVLDKTANDHDLFTVDLPLVTANQINGRPAMVFDGTNDGLQTNTAFIYALGTPEIWAIAKSDESGTGAVISEGITTSGAAVYRVYDDDTANDYVFQLTNTGNTDRFLNSQDRSTNAWDLIIATDKGAATGTSNEVVDVDAGTTGAYTRDGPAFNRMTIGFTLRSSASTFFDGTIAEILVLDSTASSGERTALATYFNAKYNTAWTPA